MVEFLHFLQIKNRSYMLFNNQTTKPLLVNSVISITLANFPLIFATYQEKIMLSQTHFLESIHYNSLAQSITSSSLLTKSQMKNFKLFETIPNQLNSNLLEWNTITS